ncbi:MAG TPA: hypothetical protein VK461_16090, partial [Acidimicrobiales bacterium]|nr:hypothetical protein [Acidimicrobiales bacterium]
ALNGVPVDQVKLSLQAEAKEHGKVVDGLGDFGIVKSTVAGQASVIAVKGPLLFTLDLSARGAENQQDAVAALAKTALGRLG